MSQRATFLDTADRIGQRILRGALWDNGVSTWRVVASGRERAGVDEAASCLAGGSLYKGTSGIALFLAALYAATNDERYRRTAVGALRYAMEAHLGLPSNGFGFHTGRVGVAYAAARLGVALDAPEFCEVATSLLAHLVGHERADVHLDVIGGAAGAIPALLQLRDCVDSELVIGIAIRLGNHLIHRAHREPIGWSWGASISTSVRHLTGVAHGAAGVGHALLELYNSTGCSEYRRAAEQAYLYERQFLDRALDNWPDFRHTALGEFVYEGRLAELQSLLRRGGSSPQFSLRYMSAWCHGAPGIGLTRLRAYELLGDPVYRDEAAIAVRGVTATLDSVHRDFSLCHGTAGRAEFLLNAANQFNDSALRQRVEECMLLGCELYGRRDLRWPCGTLGGAADPGLMLGEAGIGYFLLRLSTETPSVLLLTSETDRKVEAIVGDDVAAPTIHFAGYFDRTLRVLDRLVPDAVSRLASAIAVDAPTTQDQCSATACYRNLIRLIDSQSDIALQELLRDAFAPESIRFELTLQITDFTEELLRSLQRPHGSQVPWRHVHLQLSPLTTVIQSSWDWDGWLMEANRQSSPRPAQVDVHFVLFRTGNQIHIRRVSDFAALVLRGVSERATFSDIVADAAAALDISNTRELTVLHNKILTQLQQAYVGGLIDCV